MRSALSLLILFFTFQLAAQTSTNSYLHPSYQQQLEQGFNWDWNNEPTPILPSPSQTAPRQGEYNVNTPSPTGNYPAYQPGYQPGSSSIVLPSTGIAPNSSMQQFIQSQTNYQINSTQLTNLATPSAIVSATASVDGTPFMAIENIIFYNQSGFILLASPGNATAVQLSQNPKISLLFYWGNQQRTVLVQGTARPLSQSEFANYFSRLPQPQQISSWTSMNGERLYALELTPGTFSSLLQQGGNLSRNWNAFFIAPEMMIP